MDRINSVVSDNKQLRDEMDQSFTLDDVTDILRRIGGLSRATLFDKAFHDKHPGAAKCMWGFESYDETLTIVGCLFPDVDVAHVPKLNPPTKKRKLSDSESAKLDISNHLTPLERCLICKLFFRRIQNQEFIGYMFDRHRTTIGKVLKEWAPRWGKAGEQLSILDITEEYLDEEEPVRSSIVGVPRAVCVDGADTKIDAVRIDPTASAIEYGAKNKEQRERS